MRKLLINSTALATVAALTASVTAITASVAVADVSISAGTEFKYISRSSQVTASDGTEFKSDSEIAFKFSNKTDSGLTVVMLLNYNQTVVTQRLMRVHFLSQVDLVKLY